MFANTPSALSVYCRHAIQTSDASLITAFDKLYIETIESYAYTKFFPLKPRIIKAHNHSYHFDNGWTVDLEQHEILESIPSHRNIQKHFARNASRMVYDHLGLHDLELLDYKPYFNQILQFYGITDSADKYLAYVNFWNQTCALLSRSCEKLIDCVYTSANYQPVIPMIEKSEKNEHSTDCSTSKRRWDKGKPRGQ
ncbi:MAG: hypothetical protein RJA81_1735 [Planctomycetota bacterium]|jgi:hypothetical protein